MPDPKLTRRNEIKTSKEFLSRLKSPDHATVSAIIQTIGTLADRHKQESQGPNSFFAVYAIAGNLTKPGDRPDIDLLVVTNSVWINGYQSRNRSILNDEESALGGEWVAGTIRDTFKDEGYKITIEEKIPNEYTRVGAGKKGMIRLTPEDEERKPIDVVIVNHTSLNNLSKKKITSLAEFEKFDVDEIGNPLARVLLFSA